MENLKGGNAMKRTMTVAILIMALLAVGIPMAMAQGAGGDMVDIIIAKVFFRVDGFGSFTANSYNTASGAQVGLFEAGSGISLNAVPAPGWEFSHWTFNGNYGGSSPSAGVAARIGLEIKAYFVKK